MATQLNTQTNLRDQILDLSRQNKIGELSPWFSEKLDEYIEKGLYLTEEKLAEVSKTLIENLVDYRTQGGVSTVVLGMSGGVDSALTAALFKKAGWRVIGVTMPINQEPTETERGIEACNALGIEHMHIDLTALYGQTLNTMSGAFNPEVTEPLDLELGELIDLNDPAEKAIKIRRGNIRARLRMITLYNLASKYGGLVGSTDNVSELSASFFTIFGDQGDLCPIQSLTKSWEVPYLAMINGVPETTYRAVPTDGLGIDASDEAQLGCSYLEWDLTLFAMSQKDDFLSDDQRVDIVYKSVHDRMAAGWYKRMHPINLRHPFQDRFGMIKAIDQEFIPNFLK